MKDPLVFFALIVMTNWVRNEKTNLWISDSCYTQSNLRTDSTVATPLVVWDGRTRVWYALSLTLGREAWMLCCKTVKTRFALNFLSTASNCLRQFSELDTCTPSCLWNLALSIKVLHKLYVKSDWFLLTLLTLYVRKSMRRKACFKELRNILNE